MKQLYALLNKKQWNKNTKTSLCFWRLSCAAENKVWELGSSTDQLGLSRALFTQLCGEFRSRLQVQGDLLGFCFTLHIWNTNRTIDDTVRRGLKRQLETTAFLSHQTTSFPCYIASETHMFSLHMHATHALQLLKVNNNQKCDICKPSNQRISERETEH